MEERKFVVQTPRAVIDKGKLALIFGLVFTIPVLIFTAIFDAWNTSARVLGLGALLTGTGIVILLTHRTPRLEVYGSHLRVVGPGKRSIPSRLTRWAAPCAPPAGAEFCSTGRGRCCSGCLQVWKI